MVAIRFDSRCIRSSFVIDVMRKIDSEPVKVLPVSNILEQAILSLGDVHGARALLIVPRHSFESVSLNLIALAVPVPARPYL